MKFRLMNNVIYNELPYTQHITVHVHQYFDNRISVTVQYAHFLLRQETTVYIIIIRTSVKTNTLKIQRKEQSNINNQMYTCHLYLSIILPRYKIHIKSFKCQADIISSFQLIHTIWYLFFNCKEMLNKCCICSYCTCLNVSHEYLLSTRITYSIFNITQSCYFFGINAQVKVRTWKRKRKGNDGKVKVKYLKPDRRFCLMTKVINIVCLTHSISQFMYSQRNENNLLNL